MRLDTVQRRRSWAWWGVIGIAVLVMGAYVLFDILDVDGSQRTGWPADDIIMAEGFQVEADRFFCADPVTLDSTGLLDPSVSRSFATERHGLLPGPIPLRVGHRRMFPRVALHRALAQTSSLSADPV